MVLIFDIRRSITDIRGRSDIHGTNWREQLEMLALIGGSAYKEPLCMSTGLVSPRYTDSKYRLLVV